MTTFSCLKLKEKFIQQLVLTQMNYKLGQTSGQKLSTVFKL